MKRLAVVLILTGLLGAFVHAPANAIMHGERQDRETRTILRDLESGIERLRSEARELGDRIRPEVEEMLGRAEENLASAVEYLDGIREDDPDEEAKAAARRAVEEAEHAYNVAAVHLGLKSDQPEPEQRAELGKRIETLMASFEKRIKGAEERAGEISEERREEAERLIASAREEWDKAREAMTRLTEDGEDASETVWEDLKEGMGSSLDTLSRTYQSAADYLEEETS